MDRGMDNELIFRYAHQITSDVNASLQESWTVVPKVSSRKIILFHHFKFDPDSSRVIQNSKLIWSDSFKICYNIPVSQFISIFGNNSNFFSTEKICATLITFSNFGATFKFTGDKAAMHCGLSVLGQSPSSIRRPPVYFLMFFVKRIRSFSKIFHSV